MSEFSRPQHGGFRCWHRSHLTQIESRILRRAMIPVMPTTRGCSERRSLSGWFHPNAGASARHPFFGAARPGLAAQAATGEESRT